MPNGPTISINAINLSKTVFSSPIIIRSLAFLIDSDLIDDSEMFSFFSPLASLLTVFKYKKYSVKIP